MGVLFQIISLDQKHPVILYDGVCHLCNSAIAFILKWEKKGSFLFSHIQTDHSKQILKAFNIDPIKENSIILLEHDRVYFRSTAVLRIARNLRWPASLFFYLIFIPRPLRNWVYNVVAKNRYNWFGKYDQCSRIPKEMEKRFLSDDVHPI